MALRAHSLQSPPACSALSHLTRLSRHESHALSHSTRASVGFLDEYEKAGPGGRGRPTGPPPRSLAGEAGTGRATHTSCLRFFLGLPSLSSFNSPALGRLAPVLRALVPTSAASSPGSTTSGPAPGPSTGDGVGSSEGLAVRALDGPAAMETAGVCATRGCGEPARSERAESDRGREERGRSSLVRTSEKRAWSTARERGWGGGRGGSRPVQAKVCWSRQRGTDEGSCRRAERVVRTRERCAREVPAVPRPRRHGLQFKLSEPALLPDSLPGPHPALAMTFRRVSLCVAHPQQEGPCSNQASRRCIGPTVVQYRPPSTAQLTSFEGAGPFHTLQQAPA